jgi:hypothetical protein
MVPVTALQFISDPLAVSAAMPARHAIISPKRILTKILLALSMPLSPAKLAHETCYPYVGWFRKFLLFYFALCGVASSVKARTH